MLEFFLRASFSNELLKLNLEESSQDEVNNFEIICQHIEHELCIKKNEYVLLSNRTNIKLTKNSVLNDGDTIQISPLVLGGKGGFGSLLRAFGKQITLSTNKEACRDLTGRRIRHVNNEKKLKDFLTKQNELAKQKEAQKKERLEKRRKKREQIENNHHVFVDPKYDEQKQKINEDLEEAIKNATTKERLAKKRKLSSKSTKNANETSNEKAQACKQEETEMKVVSSNKQEEVIEVKASTSKTTEIVKEKKKIDTFKGWMGVDDLEVSSSSSDEEEDNETNSKKIKKSN